jgi:diguanylate cyclase (GGDEF)-like protein
VDAIVCRQAAHQEQTLFFDVDRRHRWRAVLLDSTTSPGNGLARRLMTLAESSADVHLVDQAGFAGMLQRGDADLALIVADHAAAAAAALDSATFGQSLGAAPLVVMVDAPPDEYAVASGTWPSGSIWLRGDCSAGEWLAALHQAQLAAAFNADPDGLVLAASNGHVVLSNPAAQRLLGGAPGVDGADRLVFDGHAARLREWTAPDGRPVEWEGRRLAGNDGLAVIALHDVTARREADQALAFRAEHDTLTGLANAVRLRQELDSALARADRDGGRVAVLYLDLDGFKQVNDTFGHDVGDAVLVAVTNRLTGIRRSGELLARVGGDELVMLAESFPPGYEVRIAERALAALDTPVQVDGRTLRIGVSIGVAVYPDNASDADGLLRAADAAMYEAKRSGRDTYRVASSHADAISRRRQELALGLKQGLLRGEFELLYQPVLDLRQMRFVGAEALLRWHRPAEGVLHPPQFLDVAEASGLIVEIGDWALDTLCRQLAEWRWKLGEDFFVSTNLSAAQLRRADFAGRFRRVLHSHGLTSHAVRLEVSEQVMSQQLSRALGEFTSATDVHLAVDDVSQGMLSLRNLSSLPIRSLKLDHTLIAGLPDDALSAQLVDALIGIGRTFGLSVVAEGVESVEQLRFLRARGCDYCQGFLLSAPVAAAALPAVVALPELVRGLLPESI